MEVCLVGGGLPVDNSLEPVRWDIGGFRFNSLAEETNIVFEAGIRAPERLQRYMLWMSDG